MALIEGVALVELAKLIFERVLPNKSARDEANQKIAELVDSGDARDLSAFVDNALAQIGVNKQEASHESLFIAGWRPGMGWTCVAALFYKWIGYPILVWLYTLAQALNWIDPSVPPPPTIDTNELIGIATGLLGLVTYRTYEKAKGIDSKKISKPIIRLPKIFKRKSS